MTEHLPECPCNDKSAHPDGCLCCEVSSACICDRLRACEVRVDIKRLVDVIFHAPDSGARAFVLQRITDVSGVSGTGTVAHGVEFPDGCVALRWVGSNPTSVVFHDNGIASVEAIHGHGGNTRIVWTSEDMGERASEMDECAQRGYDDAIAQCISLGHRHIDRINEEAEAAISEQVANQLFMNADGIEFLVGELSALQTLREAKQ